MTRIRGNTKWLPYSAAIWCFHTSRKKKKKKEKNRRRRRRGAAPQAPGGGAGGAEGAPEARATTTRLLKLAYGHGYMYLLSLVGSDSLTVNVPDSARLVLQLRERSRFGLLGRLRGRHGRVPSASAKATSPRQAARNRRRNAKFFPRHRAPRGRGAGPGWACTGTEESPVAAGAWLEMGRRRRAARSRPPSAGSRLLARPVLGGGADWQAHWWARWPVQA